MGKPNDVGRSAFQLQRRHLRFSVRYPVQLKFPPGDALPGIHAVSNNIIIGVCCWNPMCRFRNIVM